MLGRILKALQFLINLVMLLIGRPKRITIRVQRTNSPWLPYSSLTIIWQWQPVAIGDVKARFYNPNGVWETVKLNRHGNRLFNHQTGEVHLSRSTTGYYAELCDAGEQQES